MKMTPKKKTNVRTKIKFMKIHAPKIKLKEKKRQKKRRKNKFADLIQFRPLRKGHMLWVSMDPLHFSSTHSQQPSVTASPTFHPSLSLSHSHSHSHDNNGLCNLPPLNPLLSAPPSQAQASLPLSSSLHPSSLTLLTEKK